jgi:serine/threonine-protein kinase
MKSGGPSWGLFLAILAAACAFVWWSGQQLPPIVAAHFDAAGEPNGFMRRTPYLWLTLATVIGLPLLTALATHASLRGPNPRLKVPDAAYWLAPERREATIAYLRASIRGFGIVLVVLLCALHWLVVRANRTAPVALANLPFGSALLALALACLLWARVMLSHFRRRR